MDITPVQKLNEPCCKFGDECGPGEPGRNLAMVSSIRDRLKHEKLLKSASNASIRNNKSQVKTADGENNESDSDPEGSESSSGSFGELQRWDRVYIDDDVMGGTGKNIFDERRRLSSIKKQASNDKSSQGLASTKSSPETKMINI